MKILLLRSVLVVLIAAVPALAKAARVHPAEPVVGAYVFPRGVIDPAQIDAQRLTRIYYSFALITDGVIVPTTPTDLVNLPIVTALRRQNPKLEVMLSVGGWLGGAGFSDAALTSEGRARFAKSAVDFLEKYDLDGLDIDWEYPGLAGAGNVFRAEDKQNFTLFLAELRRQFDVSGRKRHRHLLLTMAAGGGAEFLDHTEMAKVGRIVDQVNLMTYDACEPDESGSPTCHHTGLYSDPANPRHGSADASVRGMEAAGVPAEKIVLGAAFYGHIWLDVPPANHGLYQTGKPPKNSFGSYDNIVHNLIGHGYTRYWDATVQAPWLYSDEQRIFVSYEDPESLAAKCSYIRKEHLAGIMFWSYFDDSTGDLLGAIDHGLHPAK